MPAHSTNRATNRASQHATFRTRAMRRGFRAMDRALRRACAYPHPAGHIVRIETHLSVIYLAGRYAYKIKKPIDFGFVDFSTRDARSRACRAELRLNRQFAKPLYLEVALIVRQAGSFRFSPRGKLVEHAVKMRRFSESDAFSALARRDALAASDIDCFAQRLAAFHRRALRNPPKHRFGSAECVRSQVLTILDSLEREAPDLVPSAVHAWCDTELARLARQFDARRAAGFVRACHGDLHLANVIRHCRDVLMFDCIEFDEALRWIDVASDLAFPVMDLLAYGRNELASRLLNGWVTATGDFEGLSVMRLYVVYRALVRTLVSVLEAGTSDTHGSMRRAAPYLRVAERTAALQPAFLLLCHGLSGSGKSTASEALAPLIGAVRISSDIERKRSAPLVTPRPMRMPANAYAPDAIDAQYAHLASLTKMLLLSGYPTIVDASFLKHEHRSRFMQLAHAHSIPVAILDFYASQACLEQRVRIRAAWPGGASDADENVLRMQFDHAQPLMCEESAHAIAFDTDVPLAAFKTRAYWRALIEKLPAPGWLTAEAAWPACRTDRQAAAR